MKQLNPLNAVLMNSSRDMKQYIPPITCYKQYTSNYKYITKMTKSHIYYVLISFLDQKKKK